MLKNCVVCGAEFHCEESVDCWCNKGLFQGEVMAAYNEKYFECLCPNCLRSFLEA